MRIRPLAATGIALAAAAAIVPQAVDAGPGRGPEATYQITIENHTTAQPLSPVGTVVHRPRTDVWSVGEPASAAVAAVAEDAALPVFVETYGQVRGVRAAGVGGTAPIGPGRTVTFEVDGRPGDRLSLVSMLVNTNDAFTGLDAVRLGSGTRTFEVRAYDAGTEVNNELPEFIPGPAGNSPGERDPEGGVVGPHEGIVGRPGGIDPGVYDWDDPVATITVERID